MPNVIIEVDCISEDVGDISKLRFVFTKQIRLPFIPKKGITIEDEGIDIYFGFIKYDLKQNIFRTGETIVGASRYYHGDPYEECKSTVDRYNKAGWTVKKIEKK